MKLLVCLFGFALVAQFASALPAQHIDLPKTCEDVLTVDQCSKLREIAKLLGDKASDVDAAVREFLKTHHDNLKGAYNFAKEYLVNLATNFQCTDVLSQDQCDKITKIAGLLHVKASDMVYAIKEAIANGADKASDIYQKAVVYIRDKLSTMTCADFLSAETCAKIIEIAKLAHLNLQEVNKAVKEAMIEGAKTAQEILAKAKAFLESEITCDMVLGKDKCDKLRAIAKILGDKAADVDVAIREFIDQGKTKLTEVYNFAKEYLVKIATNFECTDVLSQDQCEKIDTIAKHFHLTIAQVNTAIKEAIANGATKVQEIYGQAVEWLKTMITATKCEDLIDADTCAKIEAFAQKLHLKMSDIMAALKQAIGQGAWGASQLYTQVVIFLKEKLSCDNILGKTNCDYLQTLSDIVGLHFDKVINQLKEWYSSGVTSATALFNKLVDYIKGSIFGDETEVQMFAEKRGIIDFVKMLKEKFAKILDKLRQLPGMTDDLLAKIQAKVDEFIKSGKLQSLAKYISDIFDKYFPKPQ